MNNYKEEYLIHYGIPGMKWGVRKAESRAAKKEYKRKKRANPSSKRSYNKKVKQRKNTKYTDIEHMPTKELQERVNRMNLERQYASLLNTQKKAVAKGKVDTQNLLNKVNKQINTLNKTKKALAVALK